MIKTRFYILFISSYLISYLSIFIRFLKHDLNLNQSFDSFFFNSDSVFFVNIAKDVILRNGDFSSWMLAGAPEIFPTIFLSFFIPFITKNYFISQIIFSIIQFLIFNILFICIINVFTEKKYAMVAGALSNIILVFFLFDKPYNYIFIASHHFGCFINFLICLLFVSYKSIHKKNNFILLSFLVFIFSFSNPIFIPYFVLPLIFCFQIFFNQKKIILKNIGFIIFAFSGYFLKKIIYFHDCSECLNTYQSMDNLYFDSILLSIYHIKMFFISHSNFTQNSIILLTLIIFISFAINFLKNLKTKNYIYSKNFIMITFLFFSCFFTLLGFLFLHMNPQFRHLYTLYFSPFLMVPIISYKYLNHLIIKNSNILLSGLLIITIVMFYINYDHTKKINFEYYPDDIHFIDKVLNKFELNNGYAKWEYCNKLVFLSKRNLIVLPYHKKKPLHWDTKRNWFNKKPQFLINLDPDDFGYKDFKTISEGNISIHIL